MPAERDEFIVSERPQGRFSRQLRPGYSGTSQSGKPPIHLWLGRQLASDLGLEGQLALGVALLRARARHNGKEPRVTCRWKSPAVRGLLGEGEHAGEQAIQGLPCRWSREDGMNRGPPPLSARDSREMAMPEL